MIRATLLCIALAGPAAAHSWYEPSCCSSRDCMPVPAGTVTWTKEGWHVTLEQHEHVFATGPIDEVIPHDDPRIRQSLDGNAHVCLSAPVTGFGSFGGYSIAHSRCGDLLCVYVPDMGA